MQRPEKPQYRGMYHDLERNRFTWDADQNPSPQRCFLEGGRLTEAMPVLCDWCGRPFWPAMHIMRGHCSDTCRRAEDTYNEEASEREKALDALRHSELENEALKAMLGKQSTV